MDNNKKVTCVIFLYNEEKYIEQAIQSVLDQTVAVDEIIVSDDYSTDNTPAIVEELSKKHPQIKYVLSDQKGKFHAYKTGLRNVSNEFFFIMAGDDAIEADYVAYGLSQLAQNNVSFLYSNNWTCDSNLKKGEPKREKGKFFTKEELLYRNWAGGFLFAESKIIPEILQINDDNITFEDWVCVITLVCKYGKLLFTDEPKYLYRRHQNATTIKLDSYKLRNRDILLYDYLLERSGIDFTEKDRALMKTRMLLHQYFRRDVRGMSAFTKLLSSGFVMNSEKAKVCLVAIFGSEAKVNKLFKSNG
ncbi:MAG: glycosyltransferase [Cyclobacteriaceae bacterium]